MLPAAIYFFFTGLGVFSLLLAVSVLTYFLKKKRASFRWLIVSLLWLLLVSTAPVPYLLTYYLEKQFSPFDVSKLGNAGRNPVNILVLGQGHHTVEGFPAINELSSSALGGISEAIRIYNLPANVRIVTSGWGGSDPVPQADVLKEAAVSLGIPDSVITAIATPRNTKAEAMAYFAAFGNEEPFIMITSANHMRRAILWFEHYHLQPIAAPANFKTSSLAGIFQVRWSPSPSNISRFDSAMHEYLGILWYWISTRGKRDI